jgi:hypothetical protein
MEDSLDEYIPVRPIAKNKKAKSNKLTSIRANSEEKHIIYEDKSG